MDFNATIVDFDFHPMVEIVDSILQITVEVPGMGHTVQLEDRDSIENLSKKYGFIIEKGSIWDFGDFKGKECKIRRTAEGYKFLHFI